MPNRIQLPEFCPELYKDRNFAERFFSKLKHFRAVAARNGGRDGNFAASADLASLRI